LPLDITRRLPICWKEGAAGQRQVAPVSARRAKNAFEDRQ